MKNKKIIGKNLLLVLYTLIAASLVVAMYLYMDKKVMTVSNEIMNETSKKLTESYTDQYNDLLTKYNELNTEYEESLEKIVEYQSIINEINEERRLKAKLEEDRWNALSDEEKEREEELIKRQEMVDYLYENDEEYASLTKEIESYMFKMGTQTKAEDKKFASSYKRRKEIEDNYIKNINN